MVKRAKESAILGRSGKPKRPAKPIILIVCEGVTTEPKYFEAFRAKYENSLVDVKAIGIGGAPETVVARAIDELQNLKKQARKSGDSFDLEIKIWAAFDRDDVPMSKIKAAIALAERNNVSVAFSNPCFEVWGLMHYSAYSKPGHQSECHKALKRVLPGYCHQDNPVLDVNELAPRYEAAVKNAKIALTEREKDGEKISDPSTTVFLLTEQIKKFGKQ